MRYPKFLLALVLVTCAGVWGGGPMRGATLYDGNVTTGADGAFSTSTAHALQVVTLNGTDGPYLLTQATLGVRYNTNPGANSEVYLTFYTNVNTSSSAANALASATQVGIMGFVLPPAAVGSYTFTLTGLNITVPTNLIGVEVEFTNADATAYSTALGIRLNTGSPSVGLNDGFVYSDLGQDGIFSGSERSQVSGASSGTPVLTDMRFSLTGNFMGVPEPAGTGLVALGMTVVCLRRRRR